MKWPGSSNSGKKTHPVGQKANELGLYMSGNVDEWCQDWYNDKYYQKSHAKNPQGPITGSYRVRRGGSRLRDAIFTRVAFRDFSHPDIPRDDIGFRLARQQ
nr:SUMF1/EgtB/PvdO family nonheme iron enzyme [Haliscomenobacter sp.]